MSLVELREAVFVWPFWARSLLTVRAAISLARLAGSPWSFSDSTMCSYLRSYLSVHSRGTEVLLSIGCCSAHVPAREKC
jgi:hypothetical protein